LAWLLVYKAMPNATEKSNAGRGSEVATFKAAAIHWLFGLALAYKLQGDAECEGPACICWWLLKPNTGHAPFTAAAFLGVGKGKLHI
jgi:hypothetical protein